MDWFRILGLIVVASPAMLVAVLGFASIIDRPLSEQWISRLVKMAMTIGLLASVGVLGMMLDVDDRRVPIEMGHWVVLSEHGHMTATELAEPDHAERSAPLASAWWRCVIDL